MKILFDNLLRNATISATNEDESYPVSRVTDRYLEYRFKSITMTTVVTASWTTDQTVSCIALGYHNLSSGTYVLKNSGGTSVGSGSLEVDYDTDMTYFTAVSTVRSIELTLTSASVLYVGGLGCGVPFSQDFHNQNPRIDFVNNDNLTFLNGGQSLGTKTKNRWVYNATLNDLTQSDLETFTNGLVLVGKNFPVYFDLFNGDHTLGRPIHGVLRIRGRFNRDTTSGRYSIRVVCEESR